MAAADFNGDNTPDLVVLDNTDGRLSSFVAVLYNTMVAVQNVSAASNLPGFLTPDSIVSAYGARLANTTAGAPSPQWPTSLGGTAVRVRDSAGVDHNAGLAFASSGQVNYHMPPGVATGPATVTITSGDGIVNTAPVEIDRVTPGLFYANPDGLAAAWVTRARANGEQVLEPVVALNQANQIVPALLDLGADSDRLILQLYGTGLRLRNDLSDVRVTIGGIDATVHYAGAQGEFPGLDQLNVEIPRSLRGRGVVNVVVTVEGEAANTLIIRIR
jgi:uncharacterized protein (TIGR03437 family)